MPIHFESIAISTQWKVNITFQFYSKAIKNDFWAVKVTVSPPPMPFISGGVETACYGIETALLVHCVEIQSMDELVPC